MEYQKITKVSKMRMIKKYLRKYLKKDIHPQKKNRKLLII